MLHLSLMILSPLSSDESFSAVTRDRPRARLLDSHRRRGIIKPRLLNAVALHRAAELVQVVALRRAAEIAAAPLHVAIEINATVDRWAGRRQMNDVTRRRLVNGLKLIKCASGAANPYLLAPCYSLPDDRDPRCAWSAPPAAPASVLPTPEVIARAVELAKSQHLTLDREASQEYHCTVPAELEKGSSCARRIRGGDLYRAWLVDPAAMEYAQPPIGTNIELPDSFAGEAWMGPADVLGMFSADGCFLYSAQGDSRMQMHADIQSKCTADSATLLVAARRCVGVGRVALSGNSHLGYYTTITWAMGSGALPFLAAHWQLGGTKAAQLQLANLALTEARVGMGRKLDGEERSAATDARNVLIAGLRRGKDPTEDAARVCEFHSGLFLDMGKDDFFSFLTFFFEGDGSVSETRGRPSIVFFAIGRRLPRGSECHTAAPRLRAPTGLPEGGGERERDSSRKDAHCLAGTSAGGCVPPTGEGDAQDLHQPRLWGVQEGQRSQPHRRPVPGSKLESNVIADTSSSNSLSHFPPMPGPLTERIRATNGGPRGG